MTAVEGSTSTGGGGGGGGGNSNTNNNNTNHINTSKTAHNTLPFIPPYASPPPSASKKQLELWSRVLSRRRTQLTKLRPQYLQAIIDLIDDSNTGSSSSSTARKTVSAATEPNQLVSTIESLLIQHFYRSIDTRVETAERSESLNSVKNIFGGIDAQHAISVKDRLVEKRKNKKDGAAQLPVGGAAKRKKITVFDSVEVAGGDSSAEEIPSPDAAPEVSLTLSTEKRAAVTDAAAASASDSASAVITDSSVVTSPQTARDRPGPSSTSTTGITTTSAEGGSLRQPSTFVASTAEKSTKTTGPSGRGSNTMGLTFSTSAASSEKAMSTAAPTASAATPSSVTSTSALSSSNATQMRQQQQQLKKKRDPPKSIPRTLTFAPDVSTPTYSASLSGRPEIRITYDAGDDPIIGATLSEEEVQSMRERFETWDPYWTLIHDVSTSTTATATTDGAEEYKVGIGTGKIIKYDKLSYGTPPQSAFDCKFYIPSTHSVLRTPGSNGQLIGWGCARPASMMRSYRNGERRLLMRMLPLVRTAKECKKRADTHLWPKGTFVQVTSGGHPNNNNSHPVPIIQRKQQSHDDTLWKGMCYPLDLTGYIHQPSSVRNTVEVCTRDENRFGVQIAVCEYVSVDALFDKILKDGTIRKLSYDESLALALGHVNKSTVVLHSSDDDEDDGNAMHPSSNDVSLTFSLTCPISLQILKTPVRGKNCKHMQCFDLGAFLHANATVSGGRWRCGACEDFIPIKDLVRCGLYSAMLDKYRDVANSNRDKVQFRPDGTWALMKENKLRYSGRKKSSFGGGGTHGDDNDSLLGGKKRKRENGDYGGGENGGGGDGQPEEIIIL